MRTISVAIDTAQQLLSEFRDLLAHRLEPHPQYHGDTAGGLKGLRVLKEGNFASVEAAVSSMAARNSGGETFRIQVDAVPSLLVDTIVSDDGQAKSAGQMIRGMLLRYPSRANIILVDGLNHCWKRFAICKELMHIVLGQDHKFVTVDIDLQMRQAFAIARDPRPDQLLNSEELAWFAAIELMLPAQDRDEILRRRAGGEDTTSIARAYHAPKAIVDLLLESRYLELVRSGRGLDHTNF